LSPGGMARKTAACLLEPRSRTGGGRHSRPGGCAPRLTGHRRGVSPCGDRRRGSEHVRDRGIHQCQHVGTAVLLEALIERPVERLNRGLKYERLWRGPVQDRGRPDSRVGERTESSLRTGDWTFAAPMGFLRPGQRLSGRRLAEIDLCALQVRPGADVPAVGQAYGIPAVALRFSTSTDLTRLFRIRTTGVLAIFASRLLNASGRCGLRGRHSAAWISSASTTWRGLPAGARS